MSLEPQKLYIGVTDIFSVLLPGVIFTFLLSSDLQLLLPVGSGASLLGTPGIVAFLICSYVFGHFIFFLGSLFIDKPFFEWIRNRANADENRPASKIASLVIRDKWFHAISVAMERSFSNQVRADGMNPFQWCKARLAIEHPGALASVQRFEADSKFFRSFTVLLLFTALIEAIKGQYPIALTSIPLALLAFGLYAHLRQKATNLAYWIILTIEAQRQAEDKKTDSEHNITHGGGVVVRHTKRGHEVLLVQGNSSDRPWVLPKGHIQGIETSPGTAIREVYEETGVTASIMRPLGISQYSYEGKQNSVAFFLMAPIIKTEDRETKWVNIEEAISLSNHLEMKTVLRSAQFHLENP